MANNNGRATKRKRYEFLGGGWATRPTDVLLDKLSKGRLYSPNLSNVDFFKLGSIAKRQGFAKQGDTVVGSAWKSQTSEDATQTVNPGTAQGAFATSFSAPSTANIVQADVKFARNFTGTCNAYCSFFTNSSGSPGTEVTNGRSNPVALTAGTTPALITFTFPNTPSLSNATTYWIVVWTDTPTVAGSTMYIRVDSTGVGATKSCASFTVAGPNTWSTISATMDMYFIVYSGGATNAVQGLFDLRTEASGSLTQNVISAIGGAIYTLDNVSTPSTWTALKSGLGSGQNKLFDYKALKNYHFFTDYGTNTNQVWDGAAAYTMAHGYRATFSLAQSASAGGPWSSAGVVQIMAVTQLISGGYRASAIGSITLGATTNKIDISSIAMDAISTAFGFDIASSATTWYATIPGGSIFYKVPNGSLSAGTNPQANTVTSFSITPTTDANLQGTGGANSIENVLSLPQGYFTLQVATPNFKFMEVFQDMLCGAGDPNNGSRVWFSEQYAPQVYGEYGQTLGLALDIATDDGEIITGMEVADGALFVGKGHNIYRVDYTGDDNNPFAVRKVHGQLGVLSHWSMAVIPKGLFFLSDRGPSICYGTYTELIPCGRNILDLFDNSSSDSFNLSAMQFSVACNDTSRNLIFITVSSNGASVRDQILVYDYENEQFSLYEDLSANVISNIGDSNGFPQVWYGDYSARVFKRTGYNDNGSAISFEFDTPGLDFDEPSHWKDASFMELSGPVQSSGTLLIDFLKDGSSTVYSTDSLSLADQRFPTGIAIPIPGIFKQLQIRLRNAEVDVPVQVDWMHFEYTDIGVRR